MVVHMHEDCVACLGQDCTGEEQSLIMLVMVLRGTPVEQIAEDLCPKHRQELDDASTDAPALRVVKSED